MIANKNDLLATVPADAWVASVELATRDMRFIESEKSSYLQVKTIFDEQVEHYKTVCLVIEEELARVMPIADQMRERYRVAEKRTITRKSKGYKFNLPTKWETPEPDSYATLLEACRLLKAYVEELDDIMQKVVYYFLNLRSRARRVGLLLETVPLKKYEMFARSKYEAALGMVYVPMPLLMRDVIGPARKITLRHYNPGKPGHDVWRRMIYHLIAYDLVGRELVPAEEENVYQEMEKTEDVLFLRNLRIKNAEGARNMDAVRLDIVYALVMTRSGEDQAKFDYGFYNIVEDYATDDETYERIMAFVKHRWETVYKQTDIMEYWNIR